MFACWPKNTGSSLNPQLHYPRERRGERKKLSVCLLRLSARSVLIKLYLSAGPRTHTHTALRERFIQIRRAVPPILSPSLPPSLSVCLSLLPFFCCLPLSLSVPPLIAPEEWQAVFFSRCLNTKRSMPDKGKERWWGVGRGNTIGYWQWIQSLKDWRRQLSKRRARGCEERNRQRGEDCEIDTAMNVIHVHG